MNLENQEPIKFYENLQENCMSHVSPSRALIQVMVFVTRSKHQTSPLGLRLDHQLNIS